MKHKSIKHKRSEKKEIETNVDILLRNSFFYKLLKQKKKPNKWIIIIIDSTIIIFNQNNIPEKSIEIMKIVWMQCIYSTETRCQITHEPHLYKTDKI